MQGGNFIYKFNTSLSLYADNRKDGHDGFEIIGKIDISGLSEEQQKEIKDGFKENKTGFDSWFKRAGYEERTSNGSNVITFNGKTIQKNDGLDSNSLRGQSNGGQNNRDSRENQGASEIADHVMRDLVNGFNPNQVTNGVDYQRRNHLIGEKGARGLDRAEEKAMAYVSVAHLSHRMTHR